MGVRTKLRDRLKFGSGYPKGKYSLRRPSAYGILHALNPHAMHGQTPNRTTGLTRHSFFLQALSSFSAGWAISIGNCSSKRRQLRGLSMPHAFSQLRTLLLHPALAIGELSLISRTTHQSSLLSRDIAIIFCAIPLDPPDRPRMNRHCVPMQLWILEPPMIYVTLSASNVPRMCKLTLR